MKTLLRILDYFFLLRPTLFFPLWTALLAGRYNSPSYQPIGLVTLFLGMLLGASYVFNQIADIAGDRSNNKLFLIADNFISVKSALLLAGLLSLLGLMGMFLLGISFGIVGLVFLAITGYIYNFRPFQWKDHPYLGPLVTVLAGAMAFVLGALPDLNNLIWRSVLPYMLAFGAVALLTTIPDMTGDAQTGKRTFALSFGVGRTTAAAAALCAAAASAAHSSADPLIFWPALLSTPIFIFAAFKPVNKYIVLSIKFAIFSLSAAVGLVFPWYLVLMTVYYFFARWYYKRRFNLNYPSFDLR